MTTYSDEHLEGLLADIESDLAERKESWNGDAPSKAREAVCAFANDLPAHGRAGVVFVGARDNGSPSGLTVSDDLLRTLADIKTDGNIVPPPTLTVAKHRLRGADMAVVTVMPSDSPPVRYRGRIWIRTGPRRSIASAQDERILNEKRRHRDRPYDVRPIAAAALADLDQAAFESEYLPAAFAPTIREANERTIEQRLAATKMIMTADEPVPTVLGILVLGKSPRSFLPGAYVQFLRVQGLQPGDPIVDEQLIDGTVLAVVRRLEEKLAAHNRTTVDFTSGPLEQRRSQYPLVALQQLARNALLHRVYEDTHAPVRVYWYDDRIEIQSPGGPFGKISHANFGSPGLADYRNPNLAEAMHVLGLVQRYGFGIALARRELEKNGNPPPQFQVETSHVLVTLRPAE